LGLIIPENINPRSYPDKKEFNGVRIMGYTAIDCLAFSDVAGMHFWVAKT
jgi:hypothetical protein